MEGVTDWDDFLGRREVPGIGPARKAQHDEHIMEADGALGRMDLEYLSCLLPPGESWRMFPRLRERAAYLDIETTGLGRGSPVTVVGIYTGGRRYSLVRGNDLAGDELSRRLARASILVTFNGAGFDLPMLERHFPGALPRVPHLDLRFAARRAGYQGGLKKLEMALGISRPGDVQGMSGEDAVRLWRVWERDRNRNALRLLVDYNMSDVVNLEALADILYPQVEKRTLSGS